MFNSLMGGIIMDHFVEKLVSVTPTEKQLNWQALEFTAFIHYGMNTFTDREWGVGDEDPAIFNPKALDTDQWCESLLEAGMKGCIITAKHHDGFCLWNTKYTKHSVMYSPYQRDIVADLSRSCKKYDLKLGIYLSPWDRHESTYGYGDAYNDYFCNQLTELLTNYGEIYTVWFDGACGEGTNGKKQIYDWDRYYALINDLQPTAVISVCGPDVRWCGNEAGECRTSEWSVVPARLADAEKVAEASQKNDEEEFRHRSIKSTDQDLGSRQVLQNEDKLIWYPAEVDTSIRPGWFHHDAEDAKVRSLEELLNIYFNSVGGNSLLLLNIPPHRDGYTTEYDRRRLKEMGDFIKEAFSHNLIKNAKLSATSSDLDNKIENIVAENDDYWKAEDYCERCQISIELKQDVVIKYIVMQEQIKLSQRIESFEVLAELDGQYHKIYEGTTVGYKKICRITKPIRTQKLLICFSTFRKSPTLKFLGLY